ncbi:MAG TPA: ribosome small subunit-dependent GTPase A [Verrucomicrobiae bacterium]|nr:ribosome small subunit-dependent GTPase A [Verrucomicrobiae bacterium]
MLEGIITKGYSGFYYVQAGTQLWECSLRGRFRLNAQEFLPGDRVKISPVKGTKGVIEEVLPRQNSLVRPTVANVDQAVIVFAASNPEPDLNLLDRILIQVEGAGITPLICFNKADLLGEEELRQLMQVYATHYTVLATGAKSGLGIEALKQVLNNKVSVFAGPSGVGKSSLLNALQPGLELKMGEVSRKLGRGKHTTRHVELLPLACGGLVADTPGFSSLHLPPMKREELAGYFPEIIELAHLCRFSSCLHNQEPQCAVKEGVERGNINPERYKHYLLFLNEVIEHERRY